MGSESSSNSQGAEETCILIPRGGPIYLPDMVRPLSKTSDFETNVLQELEKFELVLSSDLVEMSFEDISVDELKIISDEELVNKAFEEAFKDDKEIGNSSEYLQEQPNVGRKDDCKISSYGHAPSESTGTLKDALASYESLHDPSLGAGENGKSSRKISTKRKRACTVNQQNHTQNDSYIGKVEQLVKIKQRQDEDKAAARLHSFNGCYRSNVPASMASDKFERMKALKSINSTKKVQSSNVKEYIPVIHPEVVLCIEVYHSKRTWSKTQEFLVLGCQPLTELRDKIYCLTDELMRKAGQHDPSGYFLIEEVFLNDLRNPSAINYSKPIFDWLRNSEDEAHEKWECIMSGELQQKQKSLLGSKSALRLPSFKAVEMHKLRFCDLQFRLGAGYLYCHQGDCKHAIVVRDMRLIHPEDVQNRAAYPIITFQSKLRFQKCSICKIYKAEKVTVDDKWAPENPCYFCLNCYYMLHYVDNSLIYDRFQVYDYYHE